MQAQLELLAEVEAVFAAKNSQKLTKTQIYAKKIMKSQSKKVNFEVFPCPGTLNTNLTI
ncbi:hypothetical protein QUB16_19545 [Microcoleus sp. D3_18a_C4]